MRDKKYGKRWFQFHNVYTYRNDNLLRLGFKSYRSYLASPLWKSIRAIVLASSPLCVTCKKTPATQVHHRSYDMATLKGELLGSLSAVCARCHKAAEQPGQRRIAQDKFTQANDAILRGNKATRRAARLAEARQRPRLDFASCWSSHVTPFNPTLHKIEAA